MGLTLYGTKGTRAFRVFWMLEELEAEYEINPINVTKGEGRSKEFLAINPMGKVPALADNNQIIFESAAIVTYLGDKYPDKKLLPPLGTYERGLYYQWAFFVMSELEQPLWLNAKHTFIYPEARRIPQVKEQCQFEFKRVIKILNQHLSDNAYMLGESFSAADILVGQTLQWAQVVKFQLDSKRLDAYVEEMMARPGYRRAMADA
ncbi:MAG: glutathione S-transferase family protein [Myxococcota bacterium]|nr:glutathione S-transferase family protein [Myxococcota bacterium]